MSLLAVLSPILDNTSLGGPINVIPKLSAQNQRKECLHARTLQQIQLFRKENRILRMISLKGNEIPG
jgi:hypothetical protein